MANSCLVDTLRTEIIQKLQDRKIPEYRSDQLEKAESVGPGGWGARASVYWKKLDNGELVAIKCLSRALEKQVANADGHTEEEEKRARLFQYFERECVLWHMGSKESDDSRFSKIVRLLGFTRSYDKRIFPSLVLELYPEGDLRTLVSNNRSLAEKERLQLLRDAASGLAYRTYLAARSHSFDLLWLIKVHEPRLMIVHRDIKGQNIMVRRRSDGTWSAAIGDFGSAKVLDPRVFPILNSSFTESLFWTPPEYIVNGREDYSNPTIFGDVWSFACTVIEIMSNSNPWDGTNNIMQYLSGELSPQYPPRPKCFKQSSCYWKFARSCFLPAPEERPTGRILETNLQRIYESL